MSLVIRVMTRPAFSSVKNDSDSRWRWENTRTRRSNMRRSPRRPVTRMRAAEATTLPATATR